MDLDSLARVYVVTGAEQRAGKARSPLCVMTDLADVKAYMQRRNDADPAVDDLGGLRADMLRVFRLRVGCTYFANSPLTGQQILDGSVFDDD